MAKEDGSGAGEPLLRPLGEARAGAHAYDMLHELAPSPDPFAGATIALRLDRIREHVRGLAAEDGGRVTLTHALNKLVAAALERHPRFNRVVCGARLYQVRGVHVTNVLLLPGDEQALTTIVLRDVHAKPLGRLAAEFRALKRQRLEEHRRGRLTGSRRARLAARLRLYRLRSEKAALLADLRRGVLSNVLLSNLYFGAPTSFRTVKPVQTPRKVALRLHAHLEHRPVVERAQGAAGERVVARETLSLLVVSDHRITHALHFQELGETLQAIGERPAEFL